MENPNRHSTANQLFRGDMLAALRHRNFRLFWTGQCFSLVGTWMQTMAQSWLVLELTGSPFLLGLMGAFQFGPILLFSVFAGVVADRLSKHRLIILTQSCYMVLALMLGVLTLLGVVKYWQVALLAFLMGVVNTLDVPARQSFVVEMVGKDNLMNAIALNSSVFNGARVVGPALAGLIIAKMNLAACFLINGASFMAVLAGLFMMRLEERPRPAIQPQRDLLGEIRGGIAYIIKTPDVFYLMVLIGSMSALVMNFHVLVPVYARDVLHREAQGFGLMMSAMGTGALIGGLVLAYLSRFGPRQSFVYGGAAGVCVFQIALFGLRSYLPALLVLALMGWSMITFNASVNSSIQMKVPHELRGRVMSIYFLLFAGMTPISSLFSGTVAKYLGAPAAFLISGGIGLTVMAVVRWCWRKSHKLSAANNIQ
ncbi:MAG: MFS transporter [Bacillota bacterium]